MIKIENTEVFGIEGALRGMRNPKNSHHLSDTNGSVVGENDHKLAMTLAKAGAVHGKFLRMIHVQVDITCNQVWWAEFDTYKVGTVRNSSSKMHKIHVKPFEVDDFSHDGCDEVPYAKYALEDIIEACENLRQDYNRTQEKIYWRALIELLPEGFNMKSTVDLNYETLANMYKYRRTHKMFEWQQFCDWIESLPYSELITCRRDGDET